MCCSMNYDSYDITGNRNFSAPSEAYETTTVNAISHWSKGCYVAHNCIIYSFAWSLSHWTVEYSELIRVGALFIIISLAPNVWHMINIHYLMNEQMNPLSSSRGPSCVFFTLYLASHCCSEDRNHAEDTQRSVDSALSTRRGLAVNVHKPCPL